MRFRWIIGGLLLVVILSGLLVWHPWSRSRLAINGALPQWTQLQLRYHVFPILPSWLPPGTASVSYEPISALSHYREAEVILAPARSQHWGIVISEWRGPQTVISGHPQATVHMGDLVLTMSHWYVPSGRAHVTMAWFRSHGVSIVVNGVDVPLTTVEQVAAGLNKS